MRYFLYKNNMYKIIWALREDGMEKCLYDPLGTLPKKWQDPDNCEGDCLEDCVAFAPHYWTELTEKEAFIELL